MTNEEKKAEFIKACKMQGVKYYEGFNMGVIISERPIKMQLYKTDRGDREVIALSTAERFSFIVKPTADSIAGNEEMFCPKAEKIPWDASDFDREQPVFLKKIITSTRFGVRYYSEELGVRLLGHNYSYDYKELSEKFTLLDGTELYKDADD